MKYKLLFISLFSVLSISISAQSSAVQKAGKSVFTLTTYKSDGSIKATTHGVYFGEKGEGIAAFTPFIGASSATIIDANGKKADVTAIIGANEMYDICRFQLSASNGTPLTTAAAKADGGVWTVGYSTKKASVKQLNIASTEQFLDKYTYYIFKEEIEEDMDGCPILSNEGQLIGLIQRSNSSYIIHSTDANYYNELQSSGFSIHDRLLQKTDIRPALPNDVEQARLMLLMLDGQSDSMRVMNIAQDFIKHYPNDIDGYHTLARYQMAHENLRAASQAMNEGIKNCSDKSEAYIRYSELLYNQAIYKPDTLAGWTIDEAEKNVNNAIAVKDVPAYKHHLAKIVFVKGDYEKAYSLFNELSESELKGSELYYEMAQCKANLNASADEILELLNKSVEMCQPPYNQTHAPYFFHRANWLESMNEHKRALLDYNVCDSIYQNRADANFYYSRFKCELNLRQYQQALNDIAHAAYLAPQEVTYLAEMASLNLRIGHYDDAISICDMGLRIADEYADLYVVKAVALAQTGRKEEAKQALEKAKELGDERADAYIEKYCK